MTKANTTLSSGALCILAAGIFWGTSGTAQTFAPPGYDPLLVGLLRIAIGGVALLLLAIARRELGPLNSWPLPSTLLAAITAAAFQFCFFSAIHRTGVAVGTIIGVGSAPISAGILALLVRGERPGRRWLGATLLAVTGCCLLLLAGSRGQLRIEPGGLLLALGAGAAYAVYALAIKTLIEHKSAVAIMAVVACLGALMLAPLAWQRDFTWLAQPRGGLVALYLGLFSYAIPMVLFARGLLKIRVATAVTLTLAEPCTAGLLSVLVVGERLPLPAWLGLFMVLGGLLIIALPGRAGRATVKGAEPAES